MYKILVFICAVLMNGCATAPVQKKIPLNKYHTAVIVMTKGAGKGMVPVFREHLKNVLPGIIFITPKRMDDVSFNSDDDIISSGRKLQSEIIMELQVKNISIGEPYFTMNKVTALESEGILNRTSTIEGKLRIWDIYNRKLLAEIDETYHDAEIYQRIDSEEEIKKMEQMLSNPQEEQKKLYSGLAEMFVNHFTINN